MEIQVLSFINAEAAKYEIASKESSRILSDLGVLPVTGAGYYNPEEGDNHLYSDVSPGFIPAYGTALLSAVLLLSFQDLMITNRMIPVLNKIDTTGDELEYISSVQWDSSSTEQYRSKNQADVYCQIIDQMIKRGLFDVFDINAMIYASLGYNQASVSDIKNTISALISAGSQNVHNIEFIRLKLLKEKKLASKENIKQAQTQALNAMFKIVTEKSTAADLIETLLKEGEKRYFVCHSKKTSKIGIFRSTQDRNECRKIYAKESGIGYFDASIRFLTA